jgi:hypothetical protein
MPKKSYTENLNLDYSRDEAVVFHCESAATKQMR